MKEIIIKFIANVVALTGVLSMFLVVNLMLAAFTDVVLGFLYYAFTAKWNFQLVDFGTLFAISCIQFIVVCYFTATACAIIHREDDEAAKRKRLADALTVKPTKVTVRLSGGLKFAD